MRKSIFLVCAIGVACGGSVTSVDGNKNTSTLTPTDQNQLCNDVYNYMKSSLSSTDLARLECGFSGSSTPNNDPTACQNAFNTCVAQASPNMNWPTGTIDCTNFDQQVAKCNTTVAEYTKCLTEEVAMIKSMESQMPFCSQAQAESAALQAYGNLSSDCLQMMNTCQFPISSSSSGGGPAPDAGTD